MRPVTLARLLVPATAMLLATGVANAEHRYKGRYQPAPFASNATIVYARVTDVRPLIEQVETRVPVRECYESTAYAPPAYGRRAPAGTAGGTIVGGVIGGVVGNQFGRGDGRNAMTLLGTLVGAAVGHDSAARRQAGYYQPAAAQSYPVSECTTRYESRIAEQTRGYQVAYVYEGREYYTETASPPGDRIPVEVTVRPAY